MNKSTPTTGEIQQNYVYGISSEFEKRNHDFSMAIGRFDRWLKQLKNTERLKERERIINLLEAKRLKDCWCDEYGGFSDAGSDDFCESCRYLNAHIALIKEENK